MTELAEAFPLGALVEKTGDHLNLCLLGGPQLGQRGVVIGYEDVPAPGRLVVLAGDESGEPWRDWPQDLTVLLRLR